MTCTKVLSHLSKLFNISGTSYHSVQVVKSLVIGRAKRMKDALNNLEHPAYCYFCGEEITKFKGIKGDCVVIHSLDGNHNNWDKSNKVPAHRRCHSEFHSPSKDPEVAKKISNALNGITRSAETRSKMSAAMTPERKKKLSIMMSGSNSPSWKGDDVSNATKYQREYRKRKRREKK